MSEESFSIACTTCQAQLRVRDRSAIGQILTCPKCGSMVLVEAPDAPSESGHTPPPLPTAASDEPATADARRRLDDTVEDPTLYGTLEEPDADGKLHGFWCCPIPGCDGRGFGFDILPTDPEYQDERGGWVSFDDEGDEDDQGDDLGGNEEY